MIKTGILAATVLAFVVIGTTGLRAEDDGLSGLHGKVRVGHKICFDDHQHVGTGAGADKKQAMADAIRSWSGFVDFEYSRRWSSWKLAINKSADCSGSPGSVICQLKATPCRPGK